MIPASGEQAMLSTEVLLPKRPADETPNAEEVRSRMLGVHLGVSQSAEDAAPIVSLSFGWMGRTRRTRIR